MHLVRLLLGCGAVGSLLRQLWPRRCWLWQQQGTRRCCVGKSTSIITYAGVSSTTCCTGSATATVSAFAPAAASAGSCARGAAFYAPLSACTSICFPVAAAFSGGEPSGGCGGIMASATAPSAAAAEAVVPCGRGPAATADGDPTGGHDPGTPPAGFPVACCTVT